MIRRIGGPGFHGVGGIALADMGAACPGAAGNGLLNALIAYYKLDEAGGANDALDAHTGGLTFTQVNAPGSDTGKIGTARTFAAASAQYFSRADDANFSTGDVDFTISAWVYLANVTASHGIFGKWGGFGSREYALFYNDTDHVPNDRFSFLVSSAGGAYVTLDAATFGAPAITTWYHVMAWHDSVANVIGISVNNTADTVAHATGVFDSGSATLMGALVATVYRMSGRLDEIAFWKSAGGGGGCLSAAQRTALYNAGAGLPYASFTT